MPTLEDLRDSLLGGTDSPTSYRCLACGASFSEPDGLDRAAVECSFCGSADVRPQG